MEPGEGGIFPQDYVVPLSRQEVCRLVDSMVSRPSFPCCVTLTTACDQEESRSRNGLSNGHYHESSTGGSFSSVEEEIQESSCWVEGRSVSPLLIAMPASCHVSLQDHVDDSKSDGTHSSNLQDGKFSLLQFALFNFKEALEK